jgi:hypothetical protein
MSKHPDPYANEDATQELLRISKWPEPLRLAYLLEKEMLWPLHGKAADELRRLHQVELRWNHIEKRGDGMSISKYEALCGLLHLEVNEDEYDISKAVDRVIAKTEGGAA